METAAVRVLSVPSGHSYPLRLRHVGGPGTHAVTHLADPVVLGAEPGRWWPPPALDVEWLQSHAASVDVVHLHFGFDHLSADQLRAWVAALSSHGIPLVVTVHDLVNPHFAEQHEHEARLDVLVPAAQSVLTLSEGAAAEIRRRWSRSATVTRHPHVVPSNLLSRQRTRQEGLWLVGLHLKGLRANIAARSVLEAAVVAVEQMPDTALRVDLNAEVASPSHPRHDEMLMARLRELDHEDRIILRVHETFTDDELYDYLRAIDVSLLPYAFGTHSGWVEACHDLGTTVVAPRVGYWGEQKPMSSFGWRADGEPDSVELAAALLRARERPVVQSSTHRTERTAEQQHVSAFHDALYVRLHDAVGRPAGAA